MVNVARLEQFRLAANQGKIKERQTLKWCATGEWACDANVDRLNKPVR